MIETDNIDKQSQDYKDGFHAGYTGKLKPSDFWKESLEFKDKYAVYLVGVSDGYNKAVDETFSKGMDSVL